MATEQLSARRSMYGGPGESVDPSFECVLYRVRLLDALHSDRMWASKASRRSLGCVVSFGDFTFWECFLQYSGRHAYVVPGMQKILNFQ